MKAKKEKTVMAYHFTGDKLRDAAWAAAWAAAKSQFDKAVAEKFEQIMKENKQ